VGAVNTFWVDADGALVGDNTDVGGFAEAAAGLIGAAGRRR
jgi:shikimate 5-dehydrogenase